MCHFKPAPITCCKPPSQLGGLVRERPESLSYDSFTKTSAFGCCVGPLEQTVGVDPDEPVLRDIKPRQRVAFPPTLEGKPVVLKVFSLFLDLLTLSEITEDPKGFSLCEFYLPLFIVLEIKNREHF